MSPSPGLDDLFHDCLGVRPFVPRAHEQGANIVFPAETRGQISEALRWLTPLESQLA